jgi:V/A-type H+-transporting ATPase subunit E
MPQELQGLIERLQREAVDEGQLAAEALVAAAQANADALLARATAEASLLRAAAERDAAATLDRGRRALQQAARDQLISLKRAIDRQFEGLVEGSLANALTPATIAEMLAKMAQAYASRSGRERRMAVLLSPHDLEQLVHHYTERYREELRLGVELRLDDQPSKGFRVVLNDDHVEHDFTLEAITEVLMRHLRPELAKLLPEASLAAAEGLASEAPASE